MTTQELPPILVPPVIHLQRTISCILGMICSLAESLWILLALILPRMFAFHLRVLNTITEQSGLVILTGLIIPLKVVPVPTRTRLLYPRTDQYFLINHRIG